MSKTASQKASEKAEQLAEKFLGAKTQTEKPKSGQADLAAPMFKAAQQLKTSPVELAKKLAGQKPTAEFEKIEAAGPYANFYYSQTLLVEGLSEALGEDFGSSGAGKKQTIVLEYSQPNPGKPMHLGHIRSTILGDVSARLLKNQGYTPVRMNYYNDRGSHIAELITALREFKDLPKINDEKDLLAYYVKIKKGIAEDVVLKEKTRGILQKIDSGDPSVMKELALIRDLSMRAFDKNYLLLGIDFDDVAYESSLTKESLKLAQECADKGIAEKDETGALIAILEPDLSNTILLRSNGSPIYLTSDLALAEYKWRYKFAKSVYFTASEQNLHFKQLFLILKRMGRPYADRLQHVGFGLVGLPEGRMRTREGNVVLLDDVLNQAIAEAKAQILAKKTNEQIAAKVSAYDENEIDAIAKIVGVGSMKFAFLRVTPEKNITFDPKKAVEFEGDTGAYVQYAHVRCTAILAKAGKTKKFGIESFTETEKSVVKRLMDFPEVCEASARNLQPHTLCDYLLKLCADFNSFYAQSPVLQADEHTKAKRLAIVAATKNVLRKGLTLLGIDAPEKM